MNNPEQSPRNIDSKAEKRRDIEKICQGNPDAIYILSRVSEIADTKTGKFEPGWTKRL